MLKDPPSPGLAEVAGVPGVGEQVVDPIGEIGGEALRITGDPKTSPAASKATRYPVSPSTTISGMPPTALATTGRPHAMASRLISPKGS